ncbi:ATPase, histidine kinase-, DNA gyrase B (macronuclear) [Tetrahymena thermophila SB210]|uniref:histidine kinase n=1 Tax=Tetrahymena thermophila (strain SB210) TaxID=312017 RepID=I7MLE6_TETTS|nr:ATPase, histidine kinase-, DNA gyrase B [Tetrahymena thermophila SB210]EAS01953.2 ATPase, histidine kinase-, DNA gyrase B [Tetrahymena thermophila SB210]|eukprot:XP_001022198.2 ATPase, histidine kinase-, DNA gyrase B [Tetrahymena thermophila SB210]
MNSQTSKCYFNEAKIKDMEKKQYYTNVVNISSLFVILLLISLQAIQQQIILLGIMILMLGIKFLILGIVQIRLAIINTNNLIQKNEITSRKGQYFKLKYICQRIINLKYIRYYFLILQIIIYICFFELMIMQYQQIEQVIVCMMILSGLINNLSQTLHLKKIRLYTLALIQTYTFLRIWIHYEIDSYFFIFNILFIIYTISHFKYFFGMQNIQRLNQKMHQQKVDLKLNLYKKILESTPGGIAVISSESKLLYSNSFLQKILKVKQRGDVIQVLSNIGKAQNQNLQNSHEIISDQIQKTEGIFLVKPIQSQRENNQNKLTQQLSQANNNQQVNQEFPISQPSIENIKSHKFNQNQISCENQQKDIKNIKYQMAKSEKLVQEHEENYKKKLKGINISEEKLKNREQQKIKQNIQYPNYLHLSQQSSDSLNMIKFQNQITDQLQKSFRFGSAKNITNQHNNNTKDENSEGLSFQELTISFNDSEKDANCQNPQINQQNQNEDNFIQKNVVEQSQMKSFKSLTFKNQNKRFSVNLCKKVQSQDEKQEIYQQISAQDIKNLDKLIYEQQKNNSIRKNSILSSKISDFKSSKSKKFLQMMDGNKKSSLILGASLEIQRKQITNKNVNFSSDSFNQIQNQQFQVKQNESNDIIAKKTSVSEIISQIFSKNTSQQLQNQDIKGKVSILQNKQSEIQKFFKQNEEDKKQNQHLDNTVDLPKLNDKRKSFISQLKQQQEEIHYMQQCDGITKLQVNYNNQDLLFKFVPLDLSDEKDNNSNHVLILVSDIWRELFQKKVSEIQKEKMKIFASLSHELRTPLNCSISMLEVLRDEIQSSNPTYIEEYLNPALFSNKLLLNQINDILDFVQLDSGKFKYTFFDFNLQGLLKDCQKLVSIQAKMKNIEIKLFIDPDASDIICSDPNRIRQIVLNFLSNSLKFTKQGYIEIGFVQISYGLYKLYVKDTGIGITEENLQKLFTFCTKIKYDKQDEGLNNQGCGLGLTISNSIAQGLVNRQNQEGGITVESVYGQGSTFSIIIQDMNITDYEEKNHKMNEILEQLNSSFKKIKQQIQTTSQEEQKQGKGNSDSPNQANLSKGSNYYLENLSRQLGEKNSKKNYEDFNSSIDSHRSQEQQVSIRNYSKSTICQKQVRKKEDKISSGELRIQQILATSQLKIDSTAIFDDENDQKTKQYQQTNLFEYHNQHLNRFQEDSFQEKKQELVNPPNYASNSYRKLEQGNHQQNEVFKNSKRDSILNNIVGDVQSSQQIEYSQKYFQEQKIGQNQVKKEKSITSFQNQKTKTAVSFKTLNTDLQEQQKPHFEQEGFTSYMGIYNKFNSLIYESYDKQSLCQSENQDQYNYQIDDIIEKQQEYPASQSNPQDIVKDIIQKNLNKPILCQCPQIVIVDDNQFNLYALSKIIQQYSFTLQQICDGAQAIETLKNLYFKNCCLAPKIIFLDIEMPFKNGYEVAKELNQFYESVNFQYPPIIIACTAYVGQEDRQKAIDSGMDDFINKPILKSGFQQLLINWSDQIL